MPLGYPQYSVYYLLEIHRNVTVQELKAQLLASLKLASSGRYHSYQIKMLKLTKNVEKEIESKEKVQDALYSFANLKQNEEMEDKVCLFLRQVEI